MKTLKTLITIIWFIVIISSFLYVGYSYGVCIGCNEGVSPTKPSIKEQVMSIQTQVDCKVMDGIIGPETTKLVNEAVKAEERQLHNQYANQYITPSGKPK